MPRIQALVPLMRPLPAPRAVAYRQQFRFSTATRLFADQPSFNTTISSKSSPDPSLPPNASPEAPSTPQETQRAADLAAAEAVTESDSAQPAEPKPIVLSKRSNASKSKPPQDIKSASAPTIDALSTPQQAQRAADLASAEARTESDSAQPPEPKPTLPSQRPKATRPKPAAPITSSIPKSAFQINKFKPESRTQKEVRLRNATKTSPAQRATKIEPPPPKYHISRSASKNLPIYTDYKRGGNLHLTTVRKITGDLSALRDELRVFLKKKNEEVTINSLTGHVIVKGHHTSEIAEFLKARGM